MPLDHTYLFRGVDEETRAEIASVAVAETHPPGAFLFHSGESAEHLYVLQEGRVRISVIRGGLLSHIVADPGEAFGWSCMAGNPVYTASAECSSPVHVLKIRRDDLFGVFDHNPISGMAFFRALSQVIEHRLVESYGAMLSLHTESDPRSYG